MSTATLDAPSGQQAGPSPAKQSIFDKAVCLSVELHKPGNRKKADLTQVECDADKAALHLSKELLDCEEWQAIAKLDQQVRSYLRPDNGVTLPSPMLRSGMSLVPLDLVQQVDEKLQAYSAERDGLVEEFLAVYPEKIEQARERLRSQFNPQDYPPVQVLRGKFYMVQQYVDFGVPGRLSAVNQAIFAREQERCQQRLMEAVTEIEQALRESMGGLLEHMIDRLTPKADGTKKIFHASTIQKMQDFLATIKARNITGDTALEELAEQAAAVLEGKDADSLRNNQLFRDEVAVRFSELKSSLDGLLSTAPKRRIVLEDDE